MISLKSKQPGKQKQTHPSNPFGQINPNDFIPKRFGLHFQKPTIIMEYLVPSTGKLYHHKIRLEQKLKNNLSINEILNHMRARHADYLNEIRDEQLIKLITALKNHDQKSQGTTNALKAPLQTSNQNQQQSKLSKLEPLGMKKPEIKKHQFEDDVDDILNDLGFTDDKPKLKVATETKNQPSNNFFTSKAKQEPEKDYNNYDLNKLTTEELQKEKQKMDNKFFLNQKKPGDKDYVYDIQQDFEQYEDNEWDMDEEDDIV